VTGQGTNDPDVERVGITYIDGFVAAVPTANKQKFIDHAKKADSVFVELGANRGRTGCSSAGATTSPRAR
jgi:uncharacterized protein YbaA (DUF1428 family)